MMPTGNLMVWRLHRCRLGMPREREQSILIEEDLCRADDLQCSPSLLQRGCSAWPRFSSYLAEATQMVVANDCVLGRWVSSLCGACAARVILALFSLDAGTD